MYEKYGQFIEGKWQKSASGETYDVINPATEEVIGKASKANSEDIQKALKSAEKGLKIWRNTSPWERSKIIRKISELMKQRVDILSKWLTLEVGKPLTEGPGEIGGATDIFEWNSEETKRIFGEINQSRFPNTKIHVIYQPVGVVAALIPWNFPVILASRKISTALAAGCSVICKPDTITPGAVMELVNICKEAGVPDDWLRHGALGRCHEILPAAWAGLHRQEDRQAAGRGHEARVGLQAQAQGQGNGWRDQGRVGWRGEGEGQVQAVCQAEGEGQRQGEGKGGQQAPEARRPWQRRQRRRQWGAQGQGPGRGRGG